MDGSDAFIKSVLIIDDDRIFRTVAETYFKSRGSFDIEMAENGAQALDIVKNRQNDIDFVLCDLEMPEVDGIQFLRGLQQRNYLGPIAIMSGMETSVVSLAADLAKKHSLNIVGALHKPFDYSHLDQVLAKVRKSQAFFDVPEIYEGTEDAFRAALARGEVSVNYQPILDVVTGKVVGAEALPVCNHPEQGLIGSDIVMRLATTEGLVEELTHTVVRTAVEDAKRWKKLHVPFKTSFNLTLDVLSNLDLPDELAEIADEAGVDKSLFTWQIDEECLGQGTVPMELLARLKMKGFGLSIDDFGTEYSNIQHLTEFPFSELRIGRAFIENASLDGRVRRGVEASIALGKEMGLRVVATGVNSKADLDFVKEQKVDQIQGSFIAEPMNMETLLKWFLERK